MRPELGGIVTDEPDNRSGDKFRALQQIAADALARQVKLFHDMEEKVWRQSTLLGVIGGGFLFGFKPAGQVWEKASGLWKWGFGLSYAALILGALVGIFCFARAMGFADVSFGALRSGYVDHFEDMDYRDAMKELTETAESGYSDNKGTLDDKRTWAKRGHAALIVTVCAAAAALISAAVIVL